MRLSGRAQIAAFWLDKTPLELVSLEPPRGRGGQMTKQLQGEPNIPFLTELHRKDPSRPEQPPHSLGQLPLHLRRGGAALPLPTTRG